MELAGNSVNPRDLIDELLNQNTSLRMEAASLSAKLRELKTEVDLMRQMEQSRNIPPDVIEMLAKLDIR